MRVAQIILRFEIAYADVRSLQHQTLARKLLMVPLPKPLAISPLVTTVMGLCGKASQSKPVLEVSLRTARIVLRTQRHPAHCQTRKLKHSLLLHDWAVQDGDLFDGADRLAHYRPLAGAHKIDESTAL
jgi:hypothetical protein